jgi:hypothetical protein
VLADVAAELRRQRQRGQPKAPDDGLDAGTLNAAREDADDQRLGGHVKQIVAGDIDRQCAGQGGSLGYGSGGAQS